MGGVKVLQHGQAFLEVRDDRRFNDLAGRLGHQATHTGKLLHLRGRTTGAGMGHHPDRVDVAGFLPLGRNPIHHLVGDLVRALGPGIDHLIIFFTLSDQAVLILLLVLLDQITCNIDQAFLGIGYDHVVLAKGNTGQTGMTETKLHQLVGKDHSVLLAAMTIDLVNHLADFLLGQQAVDQIEGNGPVARQDVRDEHAARRGLRQHSDRIAIFINGVIAGADLGMQIDAARIQRHFNFRHVGEDHPFTRPAGHFHGQVIDAQDNILRWYDDGLAVGGAENVVGGHHQHPGFQLRLQAKRYVHRHLIAVKIRIEGGADQGVQLNGLAFDQHRLERLDAKAMQGWGPVQHDRMFADHALQNIPNLRPLFFDQLLGHLQGRGCAVNLQIRIDERLKQFQRHLLRQAALVQLQLRPDNDDRTAGVIHPLAQQVLAEPALFAFQHIGQGFQGPLVGARYNPAATAVIKQGID